VNIEYKLKETLNVGNAGLSSWHRKMGNAVLSKENLKWREVK
jgi:hypothetical protein